MGLGARDVGVLVCCAALLLLALSQEGDLRLQPDWFQPIEMHFTSAANARTGHAHDIMHTYANGVAPSDNELVPPPLVTDIDGDGINEVVLVTREPKLKIFKFKSGSSAQSQSFHSLYSHRGVDWNQLVLVREVGLLSSLSLTAGRQIVGLSSGYIRAYSRTRNRKQVIVVVNEGFGILVFNHKLRLMWTRAIEADLALRYLAEVAILIDAHPMRKGAPRGGRNDTGVVVVGGRLALKSSINRATSVGLHTDSVAAGHAGPQPREFPSDFAEALQGRILRPGRKRGTVTSDDPRGQDQAETLSRDPLHFEREAHFSTYAFEGATGDTRWRHDATSFLEESQGSEILRPQHEAMHSGQMDWRVFRQSILASALPHAWEGGRAATRIDMARVEKTRSGSQRQSIKKARQVKSNFFVRDSALGLRPHSESEHVLNPNALVVHLRDGIELLHLYSGRPLCRLTLRAGEVHVDMDGDGVVDHVEAVGAAGGAHMSGTRARNAEADRHAVTLPRCLAMVRSGIPATRQLFNASICQSSWADSMRFGAFNLMNSGSSPFGGVEAGPFGHADVSVGGSHTGRAGSNSFSVEDGVGSTDVDGNAFERAANLFASAAMRNQDMQQSVQVAHPIVVQEPKTVGTTAKKRRFHSFFYLNNGLVSSFNYDGSRTWHTQTKSTWLHSSGATGMPLTPAAAAFRPTLSPFPLRADTPADHVLAVGERSASLLSLAGSLRAEITLAPDLAVAAAIVADYNNDGINDFIIITTKGYYGYSVSRRLGGQLFSILVLVLLLVLLVVFAFKLAQTQRFDITATKRAGMAPVRNKTTFTGGLRALGKSTKAQL